MTTDGIADDTGAGVPEAADPSIVLERMNEGFYAVDRDWRLHYVNRKAEEFWGRPRAELLGQSMLSLFPQFPGSPAYESHREAMASGVPARVETTSAAIGRPVELQLFPSPHGLSVYFCDLSDRREMEDELRTRNDLLTLAELSAGIGVWVADLPEGTMRATPQFFALHGLPPHDGPVSQDLPRSVRHPDDRERVTQGFRDALAAGADTYESEYRIIRPSGEERWIFGRGRVTRDAAGKPWRYAGVDIDVTERKRQDEHLRMVMRELLHRTNNLLAVVQGLARQTARGSDDLETFMSAFGSRLEGLGESSALLARQDWRGAPLADLVRAQTRNFATAERFTLSGPGVLLSPRAVQNLGLALHELCTNAIKYGALSQPGGTVAVTWEVRGEGAERALRVDWKERGGPPVATPTRAGFGRVVAEQMLATALGATAATRFEPDGVAWTLDLPGSEFTLQDAP